MVRKSAAQQSEDYQTWVIFHCSSMKATENSKVLANLTNDDLFSGARDLVGVIAGHSL